MVSGAHRLEAAKRLGWDTIAVNLRDDMDDVAAKITEISENANRRPMTPEERLDLVAILHELVSTEAGEGSFGENSPKLSKRGRAGEGRPATTSFIAETLGVDRKTVYNDLRKLKAQDEPTPEPAPPAKVSLKDLPDAAAKHAIATGVDERPAVIKAANGFLLIAKRFGPNVTNSLNLPSLSFRALADLSAPETPDTVVEEVVGRAAKGETVKRLREELTNSSTLPTGKFPTVRNLEPIGHIVPAINRPKLPITGRSKYANSRTLPPTHQPPRPASPRDHPS